jgi:hypothetical protein
MTHAWLVRLGALPRYLAMVLALLALGTVSSRAAAQTDKAAAEVLFREAMRLVKAGDYAAACPKFEESQRQEPSLGTQYYLADCYDHVGRSASAWANFTEVADKSRLAKETAKEEAARKRANELEPKLARLTLQVDGTPTPGLTVTRGETAVGSGQWGLAVPVDPGKHVLRATAPGYKEWTKTIEVAPAASITETIPTLEPAPAEPAATPAVDPAVQPTAADRPAEAVPSTTQRTVGIVVAATGLVALGASGIFAVMAKGANADSNEPGGCSGDRCSQSGFDDRERAVLFADMASVTSIAGGVLLVGGGVLWLTAPSRRAESRAAAATQIGFGPQAIFVKGTF